MPEEDEEEGVRSGRDHSWRERPRSLTPRAALPPPLAQRCSLGARRLSGRSPRPNTQEKLARTPRRARARQLARDRCVRSDIKDPPIRSILANGST